MSGRSVVEVEEGPEAWHGTPHGYNGHKCRGPRCRRAKADEHARNVKRRSQLPFEDKPHGTENGYGNYQCRCAECTEAHRVHYLARRAADREKRDGNVPSLPVPDQVGPDVVCGVG